MSLIRKCLGKAGISSSSHHKSGDKNGHNKVDLNSDSEQIEQQILRDPVKEYMLKMLNLIREFIIFFLVLMAYAAITNDPPKVTKAPAAYPFFPKDSLVKDFYRGQIIAAIEYARTADLSFIMFYAPWDAESQAARAEFLSAAEYMKEHIIFAAVNCWQPGSECRNQYNKVYRWPVLIVYPSFGTGIQYNGPISAPYMISFLQKLMSPIKRIDDVYSHYEEAFVVAELNALPRSIEYAVYYTTALKYIERDYAATISFYVKPANVSQNKITFYSWNNLVMDLTVETDRWTVQTILHWVLTTCKSPSSWLEPTNSKSSVLLDHLETGPALILFTPKNPLHLASDYNIMLQQIKQEYSSCDVLDLNFDFEAKRLSNLKEYGRLKKSCLLKRHSDRPRKISITTSAPFLNSSTNKDQSIIGKIELDCNVLGLGARISHMIENVETEECFVFPQMQAGPETERFPQEEFKKEYSAKAHIREPSFYKTSMWRQDPDPKSMPSLRKSLRQEKCRTFLEAEKLHSAVFAPNDPSNVKSGMPVLPCLNTNVTLNFFTMDSLMYSMFAERLGIDVLRKKHKSAVVIVNGKMETHYIMQEPITTANLRVFVRQFLSGNLDRSLDSQVDVPSKSSPSYMFIEDIVNDPMMYVRELNSKNFLKAVLEERKAVVVMYYSKQCSFCNGISYVFLTVARKLSFVGNIQFARIDGYENILPWEYNMEEFPTILFFPTNMKEETRVFPPSIPISVPNLIGFILSNVDTSMKLHIMYSVCLHSQLPKDKNSCLTTVRNETMFFIEKTLKDWRKSNNRQRQLLLHNLKQLRQLQFLFSHSPDEYLVIESFFKKLQVHLTDDYTTNSTDLVKSKL